MEQANYQNTSWGTRYRSARPDAKTLLRTMLGYPVILIGLWVVASQVAAAQSNQPTSISGSKPVETLAPWFNRDRTEVVDEVLLRGSLHFTVRIWKTGAHVDRFQFHGNVVDVHGTSEATGQRFRLNGAASFDLRDPAVTYNPDGTFNLPPQSVNFFLHKVDPEVARLDNNLGVTISYAAASYDGISLSTPPVIYDVRIQSNGGTACPVGPCEVPSGAILSNGYTGDYSLPLTMSAKRYPGGTIQFHCKTGDLDAPVTLIGGGIVQRCSPFYSATDPIIVFASATSGTSVGYSAFWIYSMRERPPNGTTLIQTYDNRAAFLAATSSVNATGPLPNLGLIIDSVTIGSVTFSIALEDANLYVGGLNIVPDWYPLTPQNEIALGYERLRVSTASPVSALGFEVIEPNATMPLWGGTPVDSTYQVTLFSGTAQVGQFTFNAPDDVAPAFVGVWSDTAFDRVEIVDITPGPFSDDDEYFGEFFTGMTPLH